MMSAITIFIIGRNQNGMMSGGNIMLGRTNITTPPGSKI
jgi:hypothetical protein